MAQQRSLFSFFNKDSAIASDHTSTSSPVQSRNDNQGEKLSSKYNRRQQQQEQAGSGVKKGVSTVSESDETARLQIQWPPPGFVNSEQQLLLVLLIFTSYRIRGFRGIGRDLCSDCWLISSLSLQKVFLRKCFVLQIADCDAVL
jgi:hypothetical protein